MMCDVSTVLCPQPLQVVIFWYAGEIQAYLGTDGCIQVTLACYVLRVLYYACAQSPLPPPLFCPHRATLARLQRGARARER